MDLAYELHDLVRTLDREAERLLRPHGLSYHRYVALVIIAEHPGVTGQQLAGAVGVSGAAMSGIVRKLIGAGLVENLAGPGVGNVRHLAATPAGTDTLSACSQDLGDALDRNAIAIGVDPAALAATVRALHDRVRARPDPVGPRRPEAADRSTPPTGAGRSSTLNNQKEAE